MAFRHSCPSADRSGSPRCPIGARGKGPARCPGCRGPLAVEKGRYVILRWRGDGRYDWRDRAGAYQSPARAEERADDMNAREGYPLDGFVVRWMTDHEMGE